MCRLCVKDLQDQEFKVKDFTAVCPFGCNYNDKSKKLSLKDVDPKDAVKKYSDSQYIKDE